MDRRTMMIGAAAAAALAGRSTSLLAGTDRGAQGLSNLLDQFMKERLDRSPEFASELGLDTGARAHQKARLENVSEAGIAGDKALMASQLARLTAFDRASLNETDAVSYDVVMYTLRTGDEANKAFDYGSGGAGEPYVVSQFNGSYQSIPSFLNTQHTIATQTDAEAYLDRLNGFARLLDQETEVARHDLALGVVPPDFILVATLRQIERLRGPSPEKSSLTESVARRAHEQGIPGDYTGHAAQLVRDRIYPAVDRQIALLHEMQKSATHDAGVWKLPHGDKYYAASLTYWVTTNRDPSEIHRQGLEVVKEHVAQLDELLGKQGMTQGTVGERLRAMSNDPRSAYANTDSDREILLAELNRRAQSVSTKLPAYFGVLPKAAVEIRRAPPEKEGGFALGYYTAPSLDAKLPGIYWIDLHDTSQRPKWLLPTLTYHESIPGHHLQLSIQREAGLPLIRKVSYFSAYLEGWALYAEQLAVEMGEYDSDPAGHIGQLHDSLVRAVRIVADTGLHHNAWSREYAIRYYSENLGDPQASAVNEVERYCAWPGQACGYMLGKLQFLALRERAQKTLGAKFDIRNFHDRVLLPGAVPLDMMERFI